VGFSYCYNRGIKNTYVCITNSNGTLQSLRCLIHKLLITLVSFNYTITIQFMILIPDTIIITRVVVLGLDQGVLGTESRAEISGGDICLIK